MDIFITLSKLDSYLRIVLVLMLTVYYKNYLLLYTLLLLVGRMMDILFTDLMDMKIQRIKHHLTHTNVFVVVTE